MRRIIITVGVALLVAVPAVMGLVGNTSFAQSVPVRVPPHATVIDDKGGQHTSSIEQSAGTTGQGADTSGQGAGTTGRDAGTEGANDSVSGRDDNGGHDRVNSRSGGKDDGPGHR